MSVYQNYVETMPIGVAMPEAHKLEMTSRGRVGAFIAAGLVGAAAFMGWQQGYLPPDGHDTVNLSVSDKESATPKSDSSTKSGTSDIPHEPVDVRQCDAWVKSDAIKAAVAADLTKLLKTQIVEAGQAPGAAAAVYCGDQPLAEVQYGTINGNSNKSFLARNTVVDQFSVTKFYTGLLTMNSAYRGKLKTSDKAAEYLPAYADGSSPYERSVTVKQQLQHLSGVIDPTKTGYRPLLGASSSQTWSKLGKYPVTVKPGTRQSYSNVAYDLLYAENGAASNKSARKLWQQQIFKPLGLTKTGFEGSVSNCAPTNREPQYHDTTDLYCKVQDMLAHSEGGVGGHAGVFATESEAAQAAAVVAGKGRVGDVVIYGPDQAAEYLAYDKDSSYGPGGGNNHSGRFGETKLKNQKYTMSRNAVGMTGWGGTAVIADMDSGLSFAYGSNGTFHQQMTPTRESQYHTIYKSGNEIVMEAISKAQK